MRPAATISRPTASSAGVNTAASSATDPVSRTDRRRFTEVAAGASEFTCPTSVIPLATLKVGAALGEQLFTFGTDAGGDTAVPYSPEERDRLAAHLLRII